MSLKWKWFIFSLLFLLINSKLKRFELFKNLSPKICLQKTKQKPTTDHKQAVTRNLWWARNTKYSLLNIQNFVKQNCITNCKLSSSITHTSVITIPLATQIAEWENGRERKQRQRTKKMKVKYWCAGMEDTKESVCHFTPFFCFVFTPLVGLLEAHCHC